ncbi:MAG: cupin domain-containing protein [Pseudomonadota bacterium]
MRRTVISLGSLAALAACVSVQHTHHPAAPVEAVKPPPGSNLMMRAPITISDDLEVIISDVVIPAGATVPRHFHPGEEFVYVIEGSAVHVEEGKPDQILSAGDAYVIPPKAEHAPRGGPDGARAIVFRVHKDGLPERINIGERGPIPDFSDLSLRSNVDGLAELRAKVTGREDAHCHALASRALTCEVADGREVYAFTEEGSPAHPSALFRGFVVGDEGVPQLQERGWSSADEADAARFFETIQLWPRTAGSR